MNFLPSPPGLLLSTSAHLQASPCALPLAHKDPPEPRAALQRCELTLKAQALLLLSRRARHRTDPLAGVPTPPACRPLLKRVPK